MIDDRNVLDEDRRRFLLQSAAMAAGLGLGYSLALKPAAATPESMQAAIRNLVGQASVQPGKVKMDLPPLIENGNAVSLTVSVESPMTEEDHVKTIHVFTERNPQPNVIGVHLGPRAGRATISTRCRLADTQKVIAIAQMSDGSFWSDEVEVVVTLAACLEGV
jgi:sulfur-oxidizing protein SoxY